MTRDAEIERVIDARVQRRLATDLRYLNAENAGQQAEAEAAITREVERELAREGLDARPVIDLLALHTALDQLIDHVDEEANVPERFTNTLRGMLADADSDRLRAAKSVVHRLLLWDKHPNVSTERYFAPGRGPSQ